MPYRPDALNYPPERCRFGRMDEAEAAPSGPSGGSVFLE